jgi:steroid delta-isomerase-like uncharacterized protein
LAAQRRVLCEAAFLDFTGPLDTLRCGSAVGEDGGMSEKAAGNVLDPAFLDDFGQQWLDAWNRHDGEALAVLCTEDVEFFDPAIQTIHGRAAVADWLAACARWFPDYRFEDPEPPYAARDRAEAILPWKMIGTHRGEIEPPGFAPTGRSFAIEGVDHWWFRDGLVERCRAIYDINGMMRQLGIVPPPGSRGERAMVRLQRLGMRLKRR